MAFKKNGARDLTTGSILPQLLAMVFPIMFSAVLQILFNTADTIVVGRYAGSKALAAVGSNTSLVSLLTQVFMGLSVGANIICAKYFGAKEDEKVHDASHTAVTVSIISGIFLTIVGLVGARQFLIWMNTPDDVLSLSTLYLRIYFLGMPAMMLYNFGSALLRSIGDTTRTMYYLAFAGVINVILNLILVIPFNMSVAGVAIATIVSQYISATLVIRCLIRESSSIKINLSELRINLPMLGEMLKIGIPASIQGVIFSLSNVVIQASLNTFGSVLVAGNSAAATVEGFLYMPVNAFYQSVMPFMSQNIGARKPERINRIFWSAAISVVLVGEVVGIGSVLLSKQLLGIFATDAEVIAMGQYRFMAYFGLYGLFGLIEVFVGSIRGLGYSIVPTIVYIFVICGFRFAWLAFVFPIEEYHTIETVYNAFPYSWFLTAPILAICYFVAYKKTMRKLSAPYDPLESY